jgi:hypothetical protein
MFDNSWQNCPITLVIMTAPFISTLCGHTFDQESIERMGRNRPCPVCNARSTWVPNTGLITAIQALCPIADTNITEASKIIYEAMNTIEFLSLKRLCRMLANEPVAVKKIETIIDLLMKADARQERRWQ